MPPFSPYIVGIGGTLRAPSSSERMLRIALVAAEAQGAAVDCISGQDLVMPIFDPHTSDRSESARALVEKIRQADGVILASPGYHGSISGLIKNAIDYTEDLRDGETVYLDGKAVGCIACGSGWQAAGTTLTALRSIVHALRGWNTPLGAVINTTAVTFGPDGRLSDASLQAQLEMIGRQVVDFAKMRASWQAAMALPKRAAVGGRS